MKLLVFITGLLLVSCGREESQPKSKTVEVAKPASEKKIPPVPEGRLPKMDPEKAKFIAVPSTPPDPEPKKDARPAAENKK